MKIQEHEQAYNEHVNNLNKAIEQGIEENQRNIAYNVSQGSVELFAIYLHKLNLLQSSGDQIDHRTFKSKTFIDKKIPLEFLDREKILDLMKEIELERNALCYGSRKPISRIKNVIIVFQNLRKIINKNLKGDKV